MGDDKGRIDVSSLELEKSLEFRLFLVFFEEKIFHLISNRLIPVNYRLTINVLARI